MNRLGTRRAGISHLAIMLAASSAFMPRAQAQAVSGAPVTTPMVSGGSGQDLVMSGGSAANPVVFKNGPNGSLVLLVGGSSNDIEPKANLTLPGGTWGAGALINNVAPVFQNAVFGGTTAGAAAGFGAFLQQTDNSVCGGPNGVCVGFLENLILNGAGVAGGREGGQVNLNIVATTGNVKAQDYVGLGMQCNLMATDAGGGSSCFGSNPVSHIGPNVTALQLVGEEIDTSTETGTQVTDRIGLQIVDVKGYTYGTEAARDDVALSLNNQYGPAVNLGFKTGLEFGRYGGMFPVASNGTLIYGQGNQGAHFTVANGIDWHLGNFTGNAYNDGHVVITGTGRVGIGTTSPAYALQVAGTVYATGGAGALSDRRHKKDIEPLRIGLGAVEKLKPVTFTWKEPADSGMQGTQIGFIAQDVRQVIPDAVIQGSDDAQTLSLKYDAIIPVLVRAVQEQQARIEQLANDNAQLHAQLELAASAGKLAAAN